MKNDELRDFIEHHSSNKLHDECIERVKELADAQEEAEALFNAIDLSHYIGVREWLRRHGTKASNVL